jgi:hypothetical protein
VVTAHERHLAKQVPSAVGTARDRLLSPLGRGPEDLEPVEIGSVPRIVLLSQDFSQEITTTVLWLIDRVIDIRCVQTQPYKLSDRLLVDFRQVIPLPQAADYQVRLRLKEEEARQDVTARGRRELTLHILVREGRIRAGTEIEVVTEARKITDDNAAADMYRAVVRDLSVRTGITWNYDGKAYSLTSLNRALDELSALIWLANNTYMHWRRVGSEKSLWEEAAELSEC